MHDFLHDSEDPRVFLRDKIIRIREEVRILEGKLASIIGELSADCIPMEWVRLIMPQARTSSIDFVNVLLDFRGTVAFDEALCRLLGINKASLTVYVSHARADMERAGLYPCISRMYGKGYYIAVEYAEILFAAMREKHAAQCVAPSVQMEVLHRVDHVAGQ